MLTITTIQANLAWENKQANLEMFSRKIEGIAEPTEVVLLPEMFSTGFSMNPGYLAETMDGDTVQWMKHIAQSKKIVLAGSLIIEEDDKFYNRLICMLPNGQYGWYDKRHLFGFAGEDEYYEPGNKRLIASVKGWKINMQVCYDLRFPVWARQQTTNAQSGALAPEYDILVYVANWPERRNHAWKTLLAARAIENQCFTIGVNRVGEDGNGIYHSGDTTIFSPLGETIYSIAHAEDVFTITLNKNDLSEVREKFPFWKDADEFKILELDD